LLVATTKQAYCNRARRNPSHRRVPQIQIQRRSRRSRRRRRRRRRAQIVTRRKEREEEEGSDLEKDPPTTSEVVAVALLSGCMEVAKRGREGRLAGSRCRHPPLRWHGGHGRREGRKGGRGGSPEVTAVVALRARREGEAAAREQSERTGARGHGIGWRGSRAGG